MVMDFVDKLKEFSSVAVEKGKELGSAALEKGKELGTAAKTHVEILSLENEIEKCKAKIGDVIVSEKIKVDNDEINDCVAKIKSLTKDLNDKKEELNANKE